MSQTANLQGSSSLLYTMVFNVVNNAIKYCPASAEILIAVNQDASVIYIEDTGPGIPEEALHRVKDRFFRLPHSKGEGSGLGLAIVDCIAQIHNLKWQLSNSEFGGLKVEFSLGEQI